MDVPLSSNCREKSWNGNLADRKPLVPVIVGPTGVGKTAAVLALARLWQVSVISADSRQVYRGMDIGTAKPTQDEQSQVPHYGLDIIDPGERYSAGRFAADAVQWLSAVDPERQTVVVGGTGFYVRALADGLFREPPIDPTRRDRLRNWTANARRLGRWASRLDSQYGGGGRQRAARTVEVALLTGRPLSWWQEKARVEGAIRPFYIRFTVPRSVLQNRIDVRVSKMLESGWVAEVERLLSSGVAPDAPGLDAVGYRDVVRYLAGDLSHSELGPAIVTATRRYAKRQETWFRHQLAGSNVVALDASGSAELLAERIIDLWNERTN